MENQKNGSFFTELFLSCWAKKRELSARLVRLIDRNIRITGTPINQYKLIVISKKNWFKFQTLNYTHSFAIQLMHFISKFIFHFIFDD